MSKQKTTIWAILFLAVGIAITAFGVYRLRIARASGQWPTVTATIVSSDVETRHRSGDATGMRTERGFEYLPRIVYEYSANGARHRADRITFDDLRFDSHLAAKTIADQYAPGTEVTVYYDPERPERAVLEPGLSWTAYLLPAFGAVLMLSTVGAWVVPSLREQN
ncbi:MAG: DUF3592 domain-containing protein [Planctomycetota bacterium]|jgi:hypothetical protein